MEGMEDEIFENGGVSTCAWVARPITWRGLVMYLDMVVPPGGILARISPPDGKASYLGFNDNPVSNWPPSSGLILARIPKGPCYASCINVPAGCIVWRRHML